MPESAAKDEAGEEPTLRPGMVGPPGSLGKHELHGTRPKDFPRDMKNVLRCVPTCGLVLLDA